MRHEIKDAELNGTEGAELTEPTGHDDNPYELRAFTTRTLMKSAAHDEDKKDDINIEHTPADETKPDDGRDVVTKTMMRKAGCAENPEKDIGMTHVTEGKHVGDLMSDLEKVLQDMHRAIDNSQMTSQRLEASPSWVIEMALKAEHDDNWRGAYTEVREDSIPGRENIINAHVVYNIK